jgi:hypothetical protein
MKPMGTGQEIASVPHGLNSISETRGTPNSHCPHHSRVLIADLTGASEFSFLGQSPLPVGDMRLRGTIEMGRKRSNANTRKGWNHPHELGQDCEAFATWIGDQR